MSAVVVSQKLIGLAALVVWLHLLVGLYPLPPQRAVEFLASLNEPPAPAMEAAFWIQWLKSLTFMVAGIASAFVAYRGFRFWHLAILATSAFIAFPTAYYIVTDVVAHGGVGGWWTSWVTVVGRFVQKGEVWSIVTKLYSLFVWPAYHLILIASVTAILFLHKHRGTSDAPKSRA